MNTLNALNQLSGDFLHACDLLPLRRHDASRAGDSEGHYGGERGAARWASRGRIGRICDYLTFDFSSVELSDQRRAQRATAIRNAEKPSTARSPTKAG